MKAVGRPRRLPHILQAIEDLGDIQGSSTKRIIDHVENTLYGSTDRPKSLTTDVRKALKYAVDNGLVRQRAGKFTVASFYGRKRIADPSRSIFECRRRRKKKGGKRRRRHRRHGSLDSVTESEVSLSGEEWETDSARSYSRSRSRSPQYISAGIISHRRRGGRHGRHGKHGKPRRRRRRGRRHSLNARDTQETSPKGSNKEDSEAFQDKLSKGEFLAIIPGSYHSSKYRQFTNFELKMDSALKLPMRNTGLTIFVDKWEIQMEDAWLIKGIEEEQPGCYIN